MPFITNPIGIIGEKEATKILERKGLRVIEHNWRMGHLEVDLIAENKKEIVFVEVKARTGILNGKMPEQNVDILKQRRIIAAANAYVKYHKTEKNIRLDVIGIMVDPKTHEITYTNHIENAFAPHTRTISANSFSGLWRWGHRNKTIGRK